MTTGELDQQLLDLREDMTSSQRVEFLDAVGLCDHWTTVDSPLGSASVAFNKHGISLLSPVSDGRQFESLFADRFGNRPLKAVSKPPRQLVTALRTGRGRGVEVDLRSLGGFQQDVLTAVRDIRVGEVRPYRWIAQRIGRPNAVRAVGTALGTNPVPLLVPCHRVIRTNGEIGGYVFGAEQKRRLLDAEGVNLDEIASLSKRGVQFVASGTTGVFCNPSCHGARRIADEHKIFFGTATEAEATGFRACRLCEPIPAVA